MTAELIVEVVLAVTTTILAIFIVAGVAAVFARRSVRAARLVLRHAPAVAGRVGVLAIAGGAMALAPAATASIADPPPATLTLDDSSSVAALSLGDSNSTPTSTTNVPSPPPSLPTPRPPVVSAAPVNAGTYTVSAGDNFWSIATRVVGADRSPSTIGAYWVRLIAANADHLVERGNPNLIWPGQVLTIPEP